MKGPLMRLLYTVKMIYNISAFYNNSVRVASLLVKITYQAIISCKSYITDNGKVLTDSVVTAFFELYHFSSPRSGIKTWREFRKSCVSASCSKITIGFQYS